MKTILILLMFCRCSMGADTNDMLLVHINTALHTCGQIGYIIAMNGGTESDVDTIIKAMQSGKTNAMADFAASRNPPQPTLEKMICITNTGRSVGINKEPRISLLKTFLTTNSSGGYFSGPDDCPTCMVAIWHAGMVRIETNYSMGYRTFSNDAVSEVEVVVAQKDGPVITTNNTPPPNPWPSIFTNGIIDVKVFTPFDRTEASPGRKTFGIYYKQTF